MTKAAVAVVEKIRAPKTNKHEVAPVSETMALIEMLTRASRDPSIDIVKMQWLMDTRGKILADEAEQAFNAAMTAAQAEMRPIAADANNTQTKSKYASYAQLDRALRPIYTGHGFALSFNTGDAPADHVLVICDVTNGRHRRTYQIPMPADGKGAKGGDVMTKTHATGSAVSYGMRYLLKMIFNISVGEADDDGNRAGGRVQEPPSPTITEKQVAELLALMTKAEVDEQIIREHFRVESLADLTVTQHKTAMNKCKKKLEAA